MSMLEFQNEADRATAVEIELEVMERLGWQPKGTCVRVTFIDESLVEDVKRELDRRGVQYVEHSE